MLTRSGPWFRLTHNAKKDHVKDLSRGFKHGVQICLDTVALIVPHDTLEEVFYALQVAGGHLGIHLRAQRHFFNQLTNKLPVHLPDRAA